jgi:hypothetical protein
MQFKFDANQEYQAAAVEAVVNLFEGQPNGSLLLVARLFDYLGMKSLYALEWAEYFRQLKENPNKELVTLYIGNQMNSTTYGMLTDLRDQRIARRVPRGMARRSHPIPAAERALPLGRGMGLLDGCATAADSAGVPRLERRRALPAAGVHPAQGEVR